VIRSPVSLAINPAAGEVGGLEFADQTPRRCMLGTDSVRQRGITVIEILVLLVFIGLAAVLSTYIERRYGPIGIVVVLAVAVGIPALVSFLKRSPFLSGLALMLFPFLVVGAYVLWPGIFLLRLAAVAAVLVVGDFLAQGMYARIFSRGEAEGFTLHFGQFLFIVVIGTVLSIWWGWRSTGIVLFVDGAWQALAGLVDRTTFESLPPGEE